MKDGIVVVHGGWGTDYDPVMKHNYNAPSACLSRQLREVYAQGWRSSHIKKNKLQQHRQMKPVRLLNDRSLSVPLLYMELGVARSPISHGMIDSSLAIPLLYVELGGRSELMMRPDPQSLRG